MLSDVAQGNRNWRRKTPSYLNGLAANIIFFEFYDVHRSRPIGAEADMRSTVLNKLLRRTIDSRELDTLAKAHFFTTEMFAERVCSIRMLCSRESLAPRS